MFEGNAALSWSPGKKWVLPAGSGVSVATCEHGRPMSKIGGKYGCSSVCYQARLGYEKGMKSFREDHGLMKTSSATTEVVASKAPTPAPTTPKAPYWTPPRDRRF